MKKRIFILSFALVLLATWCYASYLYLPHRRAAFSVCGNPLLNDSCTVLLAHMDGTDDAQVFTDSSIGGVDSPHTMTANGNVKTENTAYKFGATSAYFDGTGDYIELDDSADWAFGDEDFSIDCWVKTSPDSTLQRILAQANSSGTASSTSIMLYVNDSDDKLSFTIISGSTYYTAIANSAVDTDWHHVAGVRDGNTITIYIDGIAQTTTDDVTGVTVNNSSNKMALGRLGEYNGQYFTGYIDELRISKGIARWTANFTPPTAAYY